MTDALSGKRDFFVSFNRADRAWATWIAWVLEEKGYSVFFQDWDFKGNFVLEMDKAHQQSRRTVAILSPDYLTSRFAAPEWAARFAQDATSEHDLLIPVRVRSCEHGGLLAQIVYVDLVGCGEASARDKLLRRIEGIRLKPHEPPLFPGEAGHEVVSTRPSFPRETPLVTAPTLQPDTLTTPVRLYRHHALPPNPFSQTQAIREPIRFIGRRAEMRRLLTFLHGGSVVILGEPKIGKSSFLWQLASTWSGEVLGPLDLHQLENKDDLHVYLARQLALLGNSWRDINDALRIRKSVLLLDELDAGPRGGLDRDGLKKFRSICDNNREFKVVGTSRNALKEIFPDSPKDSSPGYNLFQPLTIGEMTEPEARELLNHPWAEATVFDSAATDAILGLTKGHPFKLQRAAFHYYEALIDPEHDWRAAWRQDMEHML